MRIEDRDRALLVDAEKRVKGARIAIEDALGILRENAMRAVATDPTCDLWFLVEARPRGATVEREVAVEAGA